MKNLIRKSLFVATLFVALVVKATTIEPNLNIKVVEAKFVNLELMNTDGASTIFIKDNLGEVLFTDNFIGSSYSKKYDLSTLPVGSYLLEIYGNTKIRRINFKVLNDKIEINDSNVYLKPSIRIKDEKVYISHLALNDQTMKITVFDDDSNIIYNVKLMGRMDLGKILNFSKLAEGTYRIVVNTEGNIFEKEIKKEKGNLF